MSGQFIHVTIYRENNVDKQLDNKGLKLGLIKKNKNKSTIQDPSRYGYLSFFFQTRRGLCTENSRNKNNLEERISEVK